MRQLPGYDRLEDPELCAAINTLYRDLWEPLHNYFCPSAKLLSKERHGARVKRRHDAPHTPCERLLACPQIKASTKKALRAARASLNPFDLARQIEAALRLILHRALRSSRSPGSMSPASPQPWCHDF